MSQQVLFPGLELPQGPARRCPSDLRSVAFNCLPEPLLEELMALWAGGSRQALTIAWVAWGLI